MGEVIYGHDFRARREREAAETDVAGVALGASMLTGGPSQSVTLLITDLPRFDTAPSEMNMDEPA